MHRFYESPILTDTALNPNYRQQFEESLGEANLPLIDALSKLLNGDNSLEEIYGKLLLAGYGLEPVFKAITWFDQQGLLKEAPAPTQLLSDAEKAFYRSQMQAIAHFQQPAESFVGSSNLSGISAQLKLKQAVVGIIGSGIASGNLIRSLAAAGVGNLVAVHEPDDNQPETRHANARTLHVDALQQDIPTMNPWVRLIQVEQTEDLPNTLKDNALDLLIYCPDRFDEVLSHWLNQIALDYSIPMLFYRQRLFEIELGPLIIPHQTACYVCYDRRRRALLSQDEQATLEAHDLPHLNFSPGIDLLALEVIKWLVGGVEPLTFGRLWQLNTFNGLLSVHPVLKLPRCPACGVHKLKPTRKLWEE